MANFFVRLFFTFRPSVAKYPCLAKMWMFAKKSKQKRAILVLVCLCFTAIYHFGVQSTAKFDLSGSKFFLWTILKQMSKALLWAIKPIVQKYRAGTSKWETLFIWFLKFCIILSFWHDSFFFGESCNLAKNGWIWEIWMSNWVRIWFQVGSFHCNLTKNCPKLVLKLLFSVLTRIVLFRWES